jgi:hypothetical protein
MYLNVPVYALETLESGPRFDNVDILDTPLRFLSQQVTVVGLQYVVQVAAPLDEIERGLGEFLVVLLPLSGIALVIAAGVGYWISHRALKPVDHISESARAIGASNLSECLALSGTGDELDRLAGISLRRSRLRRISWTSCCSSPEPTPANLVSNFGGSI